MLARCTKIRHPSGAVIDLPRLVPAFSSKGFGFFSSADDDVEAGRAPRKHALRKATLRRKRDLSETTRALELVAPHIKDSILVSAYDLHYCYFREPLRFFQNKELVFLDSGGYELSAEFDQTEPVQWGTRKKSFSASDYRSVLDTRPLLRCAGSSQARLGIAYLLSTLLYGATPPLIQVIGSFSSGIYTSIDLLSSCKQTTSSPSRNLPLHPQNPPL